MGAVAGPAHPDGRLRRHPAGWESFLTVHGASRPLLIVDLTGQYLAQELLGLAERGGIAPTMWRLPASLGRNEIAAPDILREQARVLADTAEGKDNVTIRLLLDDAAAQCDAVRAATVYQLGTPFHGPAGVLLPGPHGGTILD